MKVPFWGLNAAGVSANEAPLYEQDVWDTAFINDDQLPGKCWIENKGVGEIEVQVKKAKTQANSRITFLGYDPKEFDLVVRIATEQQWDVFQDIRDKYWKPPAKKPNPPQATVKVKYPDINGINVFEGVLIGVPTSEPSDLEGAKNFRFRFHEQGIVKPVKALSAGGALPPEDPRQPASAALNGPRPAPSSVDSNMGLGGPVLTNTGGAQ